MEQVPVLAEQVDHGLKMTTCAGSETVYAYCTCGWVTPRASDVRTAKQALDAHVKEQG